MVKLGRKLLLQQLRQKSFVIMSLDAPTYLNFCRIFK